jgi:lipopolysaccharide export system permease protein
VTTARAGRVETIGPDQFLLLSRGQQLESAADQSSTKISEFEEYGVLINEKAREIERAAPPRTLSTQALLAGRTAPYLGELSWRIGLALAAVNFVLIGLAVSSGNPRVGRNVNLVFALFTFVVYNNLVNLGASRIAAGSYDIWGFMLLLHGGVFAAAVLLLLKLHWNWTLASSLRLRRRSGPPGNPA